ncbi:LCP family protein [Demequina sp. TTPB684]|uniref:LCP family protein n=1 Tax=unclassified Demequina TaxID=2620311 RepID=UPI001CF51811|nr:MULTISPECIES: LCP family protein [unclassified Demequina]MCB2411543.1 LCP family protein [Demequina sp. TTPB684]UPU88545.1 LCP family protein [Demequina sp. TMPB413]
MSSSEYVRVRHATTVRSHRVLQAFAWVLAATVGFGLVFVQTYKTKVEAEFVTEDITPLLGPDRPSAPQPPTDGSSGVPVNILLMGSDDRSGENGAIGGKEAGKRNDTTLIMHISADRSRVEVVSIPRDTVVRIADCQRSDGTSQRGWTGLFNIAFANGAANGSNADGAACTQKTVESLTDIYIDHFVVVDFVGFRDMVDAVGGVPMCIPNAVTDAYSGTDLAAGPQVLNGTQALAFARMRHGDGLSGSDLDRIDRQQELLKNLASKILSAEMLYRPQDLTNFVKEVAGSLTMDDGFGDLDTLIGLAFSMRSINPSTDVTFATAPVTGDPANRNHVIFSSKAPAMWEALRTDQPIAPLLDAQSASPANEDTIGTDAAPVTDPSAPADPGGSQAPSQEDILNACSVG